MASVEEIIGELYLADPDSFTVERDAHVAQAKEAGDTETVARLKKLRKPVLAAWALNVLRGAEPDRVDELFALGEQIRGAQRELRGEALRELGALRDDLLAELARRTAALAERAGHPLGAGSAEQVRQTLVAALSDPETAQRLSEGRLVKSAEYSGFGMQELTDWVAPQPADRQAGSTQKKASRKRGEPEPAAAAADRTKRWESDYAAARAQRDSTAEQLDRAHAALAAREREQQDVERRRRELRTELAEVDQRARTVEQAIQQAHRELREARRAAELADGRIAEITRRMPSS